MTDPSVQPPPEIQLRHFQPEDRAAFLTLAGDLAIKTYFEEFDLSEELIGAKFGGINDDIPFVQYWGIFLADDTLVGFAALKKSTAIWRTLQKKAVPPLDETRDEIVFESREQEERRKWREKTNAPYSADVAIHSAYRRKYLATAALDWLYNYTAAAGLDAFYLEVREDNAASAQLVQRLRPQLLVNAADHHGHDLYHVAVEPLARSSASLLEDIRTADVAEKETFTVLRHCLMAFPALSAQREVLLGLLRAMKAMKAELVTTDHCNGCSHEIDELQRRIIVCLKQRPDPLTLIWSLAHELGHLQQEEPNAKERREFTLEKFHREEDAWKNAERWLADQPLFWYQWEHFFRFRHERLESYFPSRANDRPATDIQPPQ